MSIKIPENVDIGDLNTLRAAKTERLKTGKQLRSTKNLSNHIPKSLKRQIYTKETKRRQAPMALYVKSKLQQRVKIPHDFKESSPSARSLSKSRTKGQRKHITTQL